MKLLRIVFTATFACSLIACGGADEAVTDTVIPASSNKAASAGKASPHSIGGMKKVMDDAKGVEAMLQQNQDRRQQEIDSYRK